MVSEFFYKIVVQLGRIFRGGSYQIDRSVPIRALIGISVRRGIALLRSVVRGVVVSVNPKTMIFLGPGVELRNRNMINFGKGVTLGKYVTIDGLSLDGVHIGDGVSIGPYTIIEATGVISSLGKGCIIGANCGIGAFSFVGAAGGVVIGDNVIMGQRVSFHSENHNFDRIDLPIRNQGVTRVGIVVEEDCWIGANVTFLDGSHVGKGSVIAAGSVVRGHVAPYSVAAGVPAKVIKSRKS